jgi:hypothetical protein
MIAAWPNGDRALALQGEISTEWYGPEDDYFGRTSSSWHSGHRLRMASEAAHLGSGGVFYPGRGEGECRTTP